MKTIKLVKQDGNRAIGIFKNYDGEFVAMTYAFSKTFKTVKGAEKWLSGKGY